MTTGWVFAVESFIQFSQISPELYCTNSLVKAFLVIISNSWSGKVSPSEYASMLSFCYHLIIKLGDLGQLPNMWWTDVEISAFYLWTWYVLYPFLSYPELCCSLPVSLGVCASGCPSMRMYNWMDIWWAHLTSSYKGWVVAVLKYIKYTKVYLMHVTKHLHWLLHHLFSSHWGHFPKV